MPLYKAPQFEVDLVSTAFFVDTNVWVSAFNEDDDNYLDALDFIQSTSGLILVPVCVVAETWGMLVHARDKTVDKYTRGQRGLAFLAWLADPGHNVRLVPEIVNSISHVADLTRSSAIDCVDAMLAYLSNHVNSQCAFKPPLAIATADHRDFPRIRQQTGYSFRIYSIVERSFY